MMYRFLRAVSPLIFLAWVLAASGQTAPAKSNGAESKDDPTVSFRSFSRMVLVDVIVKDAKGKVIHGLKPEDFELLEDNTPHRIASFSESDTPGARSVAAPEARYEDVFSNARPAEDGVTRPSIILLDLLNTPARDRAWVRKELLRFVQERMDTHEPLAFFVLWNRLELVQDFTGDRDLLNRAVAGDRRTLADTKKDHLNSDMMVRVADLFRNDADVGGILKAMADNMERIEDQWDQERMIVRADATLAALRGIARFAEKYRGRKSLIWISAAFPFAFDTEFGRVDFDLQFRQTTNQLTTAQVAVYPVDVGGLHSVEAKPFEEDLSVKWLEEPDKNFPQRFQTAYHELFDSQNTMKEIADLTGGLPYLNRNDLHAAIASALADNRETYTLGYYPDRKDFNNRFRKIKVRLRGVEATLRYRKGYFANGFSVEKRSSTELLAALERDATVSAQIPVVSRLEPAIPLANTAFKVELFVKGGNIHYTDGDRGAAFLDFAAVALGANGKTVARSWHRGELKMDAQRVAKAQKSGIIYSLPINLPAGEYKIRAGVRDSFTGRIGTVEIPLVVK